MLGLRVLRARELEKRRRRDDAAMAVPEMAPLRSKIEHWTALAMGREAEFHGRGLRAVASGSDYRTGVTDADIIGAWQIQFGLMRRNAQLKLLHQLRIFVVPDMLFVGVAHSRIVAGDRLKSIRFYKVARAFRSGPQVR